MNIADDSIHDRRTATIKPRTTRRWPDVVLDSVVKHLFPLTDQESRKQWENVALVGRNWRDAALRALRSSRTLSSAGDVLAFLLYRTHLASLTNEGGPQTLTLRWGIGGNAKAVTGNTATALQWAVQISPLRELNLHGVSLSSETALWMIARAPHLRVLTISNSEITGDVGTDSKCTKQARHTLKSLTSFSLYLPRKKSPAFANFVLSSLEGAVVRLNYTSHDPFTYPCNARQLVAVQTGPSFSLEDLLASKCDLPVRILSANAWTSEFLSSFLSVCPHLEELSGYLLGPADDRLFQIMQTLPRLRRLHMRLDIPSSLPFKNFLRGGGGERLEHLNLNQAWVEVSVLECISVYCPNLKTVDVAYSPKYSQEDVVDMALYCKKITLWRLGTGCRRWAYEVACGLEVKGRRVKNIKELKANSDKCQCSGPACYLRPIVSSRRG
ncbi:hypothetical protein HDV00_006183 [Rhizophlyctis rosea]|nr:hypothetical protein HDV00_006183 [Rhizophlyctis rosea]